MAKKPESELHPRHVQQARPRFEDAERRRRRDPGPPPQELRSAGEVGEGHRRRRLSLMDKQREMLQQTLHEITEMAQSFRAPGSPQEMMAKQADFAKKSFEAAVKNAGEVAELVKKSSSQFDRDPARAHPRSRWRRSAKATRSGNSASRLTANHPTRIDRPGRFVVSTDPPQAGFLLTASPAQPRRRVNDETGTDLRGHEGHGRRRSSACRAGSPSTRTRSTSSPNALATGNGSMSMSSARRRKARSACRSRMAT